MTFNFMRVDVEPSLEEVGPGLVSLVIKSTQQVDTGFESQMKFYAVTKEEVASLGKELIALSKTM